MLRRLLPLLGRMAVTLIAIVIAVIAAQRLWVYYQVDPWTRDGRVRADVVEIAPDVSGLITGVDVADDQPVKRGQRLFTVDRDRYALALRQAEAAAQAQRASLAEAEREAARNAALGDLVSTEVAQQARAKVDEDQAALANALAQRDLAALNLSRTEPVAPTDGYLSDTSPRVGDYAVAGKPALALIDMRTIRVEGYFEETKLGGVRVGDRAQVRILGEPGVLYGRVTSIAAGIEDRDRSTGANLLPNVNPTFSWVRLAQRVPVRVTLDHVPADAPLIVGRTATVSILQGAASGRHAPGGR
jgi:RND family efflux transporter MFP subunit